MYAKQNSICRRTIIDVPRQKRGETGQSIFRPQAKNFACGGFYKGLTGIRGESGKVGDESTDRQKNVRKYQKNVCFLKKGE
ncbi:MAG: hypothetical protein DBX39_02655 [Bacillota bacterium]|nr:MAG: hypothetical protein DBX39_02655 [Bacillota bacterium]